MYAAPLARHVTGSNRLLLVADKRGRRGCCVSSRAKSELAGIWGHATLQTPMGIYHANPQGFQTQISLRKLYSFSTEMADSRQERTVEMSMTKIRLELSLKRNYSPRTAVDNN